MEAECLGPLGHLHFQYKQARLQALETMAGVLKERIDILTAKLHRSESLDTAGVLTSDLPTLGLSTKGPAVSTLAAASTLTVPTCPGALVSNRDRGVPQDWVDMQARPLFPATYLLDGEMLLWSPGWDLQSLSPRAHLENQSQGGAGALGTMTIGWPGWSVGWEQGGPPLHLPLGFLSGKRDRRQ
jgi:hypothetical protein